MPKTMSSLNPFLNPIKKPKFQLSLSQNRGTAIPYRNKRTKSNKAIRVILVFLRELKQTTHLRFMSAISKINYLDNVLFTLLI